MRTIIILMLLLGISLMAENKYLYLEELSVAKTKANGKHWDALKGKPDIQIEIAVRVGNEWKTMFELPKAKNTFQVQQINTTVPVKPGDLVKIFVFDKDISETDLVGTYIWEITKEDFHNENNIHTLSFDQVESFTYSLQKYRLVTKTAITSAQQTLIDEMEKLASSLGAHRSDLEENSREIVITYSNNLKKIFRVILNKANGTGTMEYLPGGLKPEK